MTEKEFGICLKPLVDLSPRLEGWCKTTNKEGTQRWRLWARRASDVDADYFAEVCEVYAKYPSTWQAETEEMLAEMLQEARDRRAKEYDKLEQYSKHHARKRAPWREKSKVPCVVAIQHILTRGPVDAEQLEELVQWGAWDGERPRWLDDDNLEDDE